MHWQLKTRFCWLYFKSDCDKEILLFDYWPLQGDFLWVNIKPRMVCAYNRYPLLKALMDKPFFAKCKVANIKAQNTFFKVRFKFWYTLRKTGQFFPFFNAIFALEFIFFDSFRWPIFSCVQKQQTRVLNMSFSGSRCHSQIMLCSIDKAKILIGSAELLSAVTGHKLVLSIAL